MREQIVALFDRFKVSNPFGDLMLNGSEGVQDEKRERERERALGKFRLLFSSP